VAGAAGHGAARVAGCRVGAPLSACRGRRHLGPSVGRLHLPGRDLVALPALRAARARRVVARAAVAVADDPAGSAVDVLAAALDDPALRVAYPAPDGAWRDYRGQMVVLPERDVTMVTDAGEIVAALIHGRLGADRPRLPGRGGLSGPASS
jgi:hypothetical protein